MKHGISVVSVVYNEEKRIERFIKSFYNFDEIILVNKSSTDRTAEIAESLGAKVITVPYGDNPHLIEPALEAATSDWVFLLTASDVIHPEYTKLLYKLIDDEDFESKYDIITYNCVMHVLGINNPYSVFDNKYRNGLCKKAVLSITDRVHHEYAFASDRVYTTPFDREVAVHHLSHETVDMYYDRQLRYSKQEMEHRVSLKSYFKVIIKEIKNGFNKKFWKAGWKGLGLVLMMVNYRILIYLRAMEAEIGNVPELYNEYAKSLYEMDKMDFRNEEYKKLSNK